MLRTFNEWLKEFGFTWVEGREEMYKAQMTEFNAMCLVHELRSEGAIKDA